MRKKLANIFIGVILILIGGLYIFSYVSNTDIEIFFDGWWTLFIILPCMYSMIAYGVNAGNIIGTGIGVLLLLSAQDFIRFKDAWKISIPAILIIIGLSIILKPTFHKNNTQKVTYSSDGSIPSYCAVFGGQTPNFTDVDFKGAKASGIFGGVDLNLRNSVIREDCLIEVSAIFGGVDIYLPSNVKAIVNTTPIFGGTDVTFDSSTDSAAPIVTINATCIFGGCDIK